jgi:hypothetical protein
MRRSQLASIHPVPAAELFSNRLGQFCKEALPDPAPDGGSATLPKDGVHFASVNTCPKISTGLLCFAERSQITVPVFSPESAWRRVPQSYVPARSSGQ